MKSFSRLIAPHVQAEISAASTAHAKEDYLSEFVHLERAHVLGQASTYLHLKVHCLMFVWGWRQRSGRECFGQLLRILGAATKTAMGLVPAGNTGGANVSPFKVMPIPAVLKAHIQAASSPR